MTAETIKACCADLYANDWVRVLVGEPFHPGGLALTERLAVLLGLDASSRDGLSEQVEFLQGDAEQLSALANDSFDAVICECAYCTFPQTRSPWRASATR
jgi:hypothetical protein